MTRRKNPGLSVEATYKAHPHMGYPDSFANAYPDADQERLNEWKDENPDSAVIDLPNYMQIVAKIMRDDVFGGMDRTFNVTKVTDAAAQLSEYWVLQKFPADFNLYTGSDMSTATNRLLTYVCMREIFLTWLDRDWRLRLGWDQLLYSREWLESLRLSTTERDKVVSPHVIEESMTEWVLEEWSETKQPMLPGGSGLDVPDTLWAQTVGEVYEIAKDNRELVRGFGRKTLEYFVHYMTREYAIQRLVPKTLKSMDGLMREPRKDKGGLKHDPIKNMTGEYQ